MKMAQRVKIALAGGVLALSALALNLSPASAGSVMGPDSTGDVILAHSRDVYQVDFWGGETARATAVADGDVDIFVYDEDGDLVASDNSSSSTASVSWRPGYTQTFTIVVVNPTGDDLPYGLAVN